MESEPVVFIVDDDASVRRVWSGWCAPSACGKPCLGPEFLQCAASDGPSCLVLDVRMPGVSGWLCRRRWRRGASHPHHLHYRSRRYYHERAAVEAGAVDFLPKPFNDQDLLEAIQGDCGISRPVRCGQCCRPFSSGQIC